MLRINSCSPHRHPEQGASGAHNQLDKHQPSIISSFQPRPSPTQPSGSKGDKMLAVYQTDSISFGQINTSYQKHGFGILQNMNFDTYVGHWKNNRADGLGLMILRNSYIVYSHFSKNRVEGVSIYDNGHTLLCGVDYEGLIEGIGFIYNYADKLWKMNRFHHGTIVEKIKQEHADIAVMLPRMITIEQSLFFHLYSYTQGKFFHDDEMLYCDQEGANHYCFGYRGPNGLHGPGIKIKDFKIIEAGFYEDGQLNGFGFKKDPEQHHHEFGKYYKGQKNGVFMQSKRNQLYYYEYRKGKIIKQVQEPSQSLFDQQKQFNFNRKDFFSSKNTLPFDLYNKKLSSKSDNKQGDKINRTESIKKSTKPNHRIIKQSKSPSNNKKNSKAYLNTQQFVRDEKSSLKIMREKISEYRKIVHNEVTGNKSQQEHDSPDNHPNWDQQSVGCEDNPFVFKVPR